VMSKKAKAIYAYQGERSTDLAFNVGDIITVVSESSASGPDWWEGELNGRRGPFPLNHVEILKGKAASFSSPSPAPAHPGFSEPKIGKPKRPVFFEYDHIAWKFALGFSLLAAVAMLIALIMPWYFIASPQVAIQEFQFLGIKNYQQAQLTNPRAVLISTTGDYKTYDQLKLPKTKQLEAITLALLLIAFFLQFTVTLLLFLRVREFLNTVFYLPILSLVAFILILIAPLNYANSINKVIKAEIDTTSTVGPSVTFQGSRTETQTVTSNGTILGVNGVQSWGPTVSWALAVVAIFPAFACYITLFLIILGRRVICIGNRLKG